MLLTDTSGVGFHYIKQNMKPYDMDEKLFAYLPQGSWPV